MSQTPAYPAPPGVTPNFVNPPSIAWKVSAISIPFSIAATVFVMLRYYARVFINKAVGIDDVFIMIALLISWMFFALGVANIPYGYGVDLWNLYASDVAMFLKLDLGGQVTYFMGTLFLKLSIILFYLRINPDQTFRRIAYGIGIFDVVYILLSCGIAIFGCTPLQGGWDVTIKATCVNKKAYYYAQAIFNIVTDFATLFLPIKMCLELRVPRRQRWMLGILFAVGSFACIVSIIRLVTMVPSFHSINFTVFKVQVAGWAEVEINVGIICACLPCLKPILNRHMPSLMNSRGSSKDSSARTPRSMNNHFEAKSYRNYQMSNIDGEDIREAHRLSSSGNSERAAEEIKNKIRGWERGKGESGTKIVAKQDDEESESVRRMLNGKGGGGEGPGGDGVMKTVVYDVRYQGV